MLRLFVAITPPDEIKDQIVTMQSGLPDARWIRRENLHLTMKFIGEVDNNLAEDIHYALSRLNFENFLLRLKGVNTFRSRKLARSIWIGIEPSSPLKVLHKRIESNLIKTGLTFETRKFTPHVTLARFKRTPITRLIPYLESNAGFQTPLFEINQVILFRSNLAANGADYEQLATYPEFN